MRKVWKRYVLFSLPSAVLSLLIGVCIAGRPVQKGKTMTIQKMEVVIHNYYNCEPVDSDEASNPKAVKKAA